MVSGTALITFLMKCSPGATEKEDVAPSENAISLYVDDPDDAATRYPLFCLNFILSYGRSLVEILCRSFISYDIATRLKNNEN